jgi:hypothetical protein
MLVDLLAPFAEIDHVMVGRNVVSLSILLWDSVGQYYRGNQAVISKVVDAELPSVLPGDILADLKFQRAVCR